MRSALICITVALVQCCTAAARADDRDFSGVVTRVFDGDSFLVRPSDDTRARDVDVRLMDIDAPEKDQPYGDTARAALEALIEGRRVFVDVITIDRYERKIARVYREPDRLDVTTTLVHDGHVWVNRRFSQDAALLSLEDQARSKRAGLWSRPNAELVPPWVHRGQKDKKQQKN